MRGALDCMRYLAGGALACAGSSADLGLLQLRLRPHKGIKSFNLKIFKSKILSCDMALLY